MKMQAKSFEDYVGLVMKCGCERQHPPLSMVFKEGTNRFNSPSATIATSQFNFAEANITSERKD